MHILIVACATKIGQICSFGKLGTQFFVTSDCFFKHNWRTRESTVVVFGVCLELLSGTLNLGVGNPNGISFTLLLVVHNLSFAEWALLEELQSPVCLLAWLLLFQTKNCLGMACLVFLGEFYDGGKLVRVVLADIVHELWRRTGWKSAERRGTIDEFLQLFILQAFITSLKDASLACVCSLCCSRSGEGLRALHRAATQA
ncbi:hypothetical protein CY35_18G063300 [Sphagnum magellanicum]|nr:hypothetical protein CY35_18G063300 [Sphagnum magellanicum]